MLHKDAFETCSNGYVAALAVLGGESRQGNTGGGRDTGATGAPPTPTLGAHMEKAWETSTEGSSLQGVHVSPFNTYKNRAGLLKEFYFKSNSKNKRQNKNICFVRKLRPQGPQLSHFQTSAHLRPSSCAASLAFPADLLE